MHPWASTIFGSGSPSFGSPTIAALEPQFTAEARVRIDDNTEAHDERLNRPLKKTCRCKVPPVRHLLDPSIDEENWASRTMKGPPSDTPNLDDILARDFAELKVGEANIEVETTPEVEVSEETVATQPIVYNQRIDSVEDRASFTVEAPKPTKATSASEEDEQEMAPVQEVLKTPTSTLGDDFDVEW